MVASCCIKQTMYWKLGCKLHFCSNPGQVVRASEEGSKQRAKWVKMAAQKIAEGCWRIVRVEKGLHFDRTLGLLLAKSKALACAILSLLWPFAELHPVSKSGNPGILELSKITRCGLTNAIVEKSNLKFSQGRQLQYLTPRTGERGVPICATSQHSKGHHLGQASHSCTHKSLATTHGLAMRSLWHLRSLYTINCLDQKFCCDSSPRPHVAAVTTKQTRRCHRDGSFGTKRIKKTNFIFIHIIITLFYIYIYHIVYSTLYHFTVSYGERPAQLTATPMPRSQGFQQKGRAQGLGQLTQPGILKDTRPGKHTKNYGKSPFLMGKSTISMAIFNSYVKLPEGSFPIGTEAK